MTCAQVLGRRCHRRIVGGYLICAGENVAHIFNSDHGEPARLTLGAAPRPTPDKESVLQVRRDPTVQIDWTTIR
jgi:hypothetical protein